MRYITIFRPGEEATARPPQEIVELTKRFLTIMGEGESEIRLMPDAPAYQRA